MKIEKQIAKLPPYNANLYVKKTISGSFYYDSNDLLIRANIFRNGISHDSLSTKAKTYVDLIMSIECSLKSMIISLSSKNESPEDAYLKARRCSHNLDKLYIEVKIRAKNRIKLLSKESEAILIKANSLGVGYRYNITSFMFISQESWADRGPRKGKVSSILNHNFINQLTVVASQMMKIASKANEKYLGRYGNINTGKWEETEYRHTKFVTNLGKQFS